MFWRALLDASCFLAGVPDSVLFRVKLFSRHYSVSDNLPLCSALEQAGILQTQTRWRFLPQTGFLLLINSMTGIFRLEVLRTVWTYRNFSYFSLSLLLAIDFDSRFTKKHNTLQHNGLHCLSIFFLTQKMILLKTSIRHEVPSEFHQNNSLQSDISVMTLFRRAFSQEPRYYSATPFPQSTD